MNMTRARTPEEIEALRQRLGESGLSRSNPRSHTAIEDFKAGLGLEECAAKAVQQEASAREAWVTAALAPWAKRHGLTHAQALSVAFDDQPFNPSNPHRDQVTMRDLHAWSGQQHGFAAYLMREAAVDTQAEDEPDDASRPQG